MRQPWSRTILTQILFPVLWLLAVRPGDACAQTVPGSGDNLAAGDALTDPRNPIRNLFGGERLDLWSLRKPMVAVSDTAAASAAHSDSSGTAAAAVIDRMTGERLRQAGLTRSVRADRRTLIRRLSCDLTGLPPSADDVDAFIADESPDAYARLVDRLLASPAYGERQARLWLDVVRYADTHGYERDEFRPLAWQYRDYVIRSFNQDKPFDQFIVEQLAGDELISQHRREPTISPSLGGGAEAAVAVESPADDEVPVPRTTAEADMLIATGYLRLGQWDSTAAIFQEEERLQAEVLADLTNTTASAFLAQTMSCCQCHDHKYDPLSQADHFRLRAFFAAVRPNDSVIVSLAAETAAIEENNAGLKTRLAALRTEHKSMGSNQGADRRRRQQLSQEIELLESQLRKPQYAMAAVDSAAIAPVTRILLQGDHASPGEEVEPGFPTVLAPGPAAIVAPRPGTTGRRLALARWIASAENPWTARVLVNRIWQQHFGIGIVATANDFGHSGAHPTHPELLDWLATSFVTNGWSVRQLHRGILLSETWCQSSRNHGPEPEKSDPENQLLWRQNMRRLDAEALRDALLSVSGLLRPYAGGRPLWPNVPDELTHAQPAILEALKNDDGGRMQGWYTDPPEQTDVRSIFLVRKRCLPVPFLQAFDLPDSTVSCARRETTVVAPQALMLLNGPDGIRCAEALARRVLNTGRADLTLSRPSSDIPSLRGQRVADLFRIALQRPPSADEQQLALDLWGRHEQLRGDDVPNAAFLAFADLCRAVLNLNEFAWVD